FDAADRNCRRIEALEPQHRSDPLLYSAMILLHHIVKVFATTNLHARTHAPGGFQFPNRPVRGGVPVQCDHSRWSVVPNRLAEEPLGGSHIALLAEQEVDGLPEFVDCAIQIHPAALDLDVCLVTSPGAIDRPRIPTPTLFKFRNIALNPAQNRRMYHDDATFRHHLD